MAAMSRSAEVDASANPRGPGRADGLDAYEQVRSPVRARCLESAQECVRPSTSSTANFLEDRGSSWGELVDDLEALSNVLGLLPITTHHSIRSEGGVSGRSIGPGRERRASRSSSSVGDRIELRERGRALRASAVGTRARASSEIYHGSIRTRSDLIMEWDRVVEMDTGHVTNAVRSAFARGV